MEEIENVHKDIITVLVMMLVSITRRLPGARELSSGITTLALAGIVLLVAAGGASAATEITSLPYTADGDGEYYYLTGDLTCADNDTQGIIIAANNVTIDGYHNGQVHSITGNKSYDTCNHYNHGGSQSCPAYHCGIRNEGDFDNVVIKNLEIKNFCTGIGLGGLSAHVDNNTITGCTIHDNGIGAWSQWEDEFITHGIHLVWTNNCNISYNDIYDNLGTGDGCGDGGDGLFMYGSSVRGRYNTITRNNFINNTKTGCFLKMKAQYNNITYNNVTKGHWEGGFSFMCMHTSYNFIEGNNVSGNDGWGIEIGGFNNTLINNTVCDNGKCGITLDRCWDGYGGSGRNKLINNTVCRNNGVNAPHFAGIYLAEGGAPDSPPYNELYNNTVCNNPGNDIKNNDPSTTGDWNMCDTTCGSAGYYDLHHATGQYCVLQCPFPGPDLVIRDLDAYWVSQPDTYNVSFTVYNQGGAAANASNASVEIVNRTGVTVFTAKYDISELPPDTGCPMEIGPFDFATALAPHDITVCADIDNNVTEVYLGDSHENNNCSVDVFGAPDLVLTSFPEENWTCLSAKSFTLNYTVENRGDVATTTGFWVRIMEDNGAWGPCFDYVAVLLNPGDNVTRTVGPFVAIGNDKVQVYADFNDTMVENDEECNAGSCSTDNCDCRVLEYTGPCKECGDVDCSGGLPAPNDVQQLRDKVRNPQGVTLDCGWAGDVDSSCGLPAPNDVQQLRDKVRNPQGVTLDCCEGCECW